MYLISHNLIFKLVGWSRGGNVIYDLFGIGLPRLGSEGWHILLNNPIESQEETKK